MGGNVKSIDSATLQHLLEQGQTILCITGLPTHGEVITPDDAADLAKHGYLRADAAGTVRAVPAQSESGDVINITLVAGEFFPCMVRRVHSTGTTATPLHLFY